MRRRWKRGKGKGKGKGKKGGKAKGGGTSGKRPCYYYVIGKCSKGNECTFSHKEADLANYRKKYKRPRPAAPAQLDMSGKVVPSTQQPVPKAKAKAGGRRPTPAAAGGDKYLYKGTMTTQERNRLNKEAKICLDYLDGKCERGGNCKLAHRPATEEDKKWAEKIRSNAAAGKGKKGKGKGGKGKGKKGKGKGKGRPPPHSVQVECTQFKAGNCEYGDDCKFLHTPS